jgi:cyclopropane fatty-acyl-phospholipid synthase-like methyltransferase
LERIPEPELMDDLEQARAYAGADFSEPHEAFVRHFRERFPGHVPRRVLDLGCGAADVTIRFARAYPEAAITGVDGARAMLDLARAAVERSGMQPRIHLALARLPQAALAERFDTVISNSLLHHLADPVALWEAVERHAQRGAAVFVMDLARPASREEAERLVEEHAAGEPDILRRDFFNSLLAAYRPEEIAAQLARAGLDLHIETVSDRHVAVFGRV